MTTILICFSSFSLGWFAWAMTSNALESFSKYQQNIRLKNLMTTPLHRQGPSVRKSLPFQTLLAFFENNSSIFLKRKWFEKYQEYILKQLTRMNRVDIKPIQVLGYQIFGSVLAGLFFGLLSENL